MSSRKRKALIRTAERVALTILALDILAYLGLVFGLGNRVRAAQDTRDALLRQVRDEQKRVARLKKFQASLPDARKVLEQFEQDRVPSRRQGFSRAARLVREIGERSGVEISGISYKLASDKAKPLERLEMSVNADGLYPGLVRFAHAMETAGDFVVIRDFNFQQAEGGMLGLRMSADLYLKR